MHRLDLFGCRITPLGDYLKGLAILRLVGEQVDANARGCWAQNHFQLHSKLDQNGLIDFLVNDYRPTPILAPWNGGSGFCNKPKKQRNVVGIDAIAASINPRFADYRAAIGFLRGHPAVIAGKAEKDKEKERRTTILQDARNNLSDAAVEWLDAAVGLAADGRRSFAPVLGTGGNEGHLDYTNNFMERLTNLVVAPKKNVPVRELLTSALFGSHANAFQPGAAGQYDPGKAGGFNQSAGIESPKIPVNPWDLVLTLEGAVAWASGLYRRQGVSFGSIFCSPFTVRASGIGYGSASTDEEVRAELWTPLWERPTRYAELKILLREGRANIDQRPAKSGIEFAEAAASLGVDRGLSAFVRYSFLQRRGDSYIALPSGKFPVGYRDASDHVRELRPLLASLGEDLPAVAKRLKRQVDNAMYEALLHGRRADLRNVMASLGRLLRSLWRSGKSQHAPPVLQAGRWMAACGGGLEVRIAAALASIWDSDAGGFRHHLIAGSSAFAWQGANFSARLISVIETRLRLAAKAGLKRNPFAGKYELHPGDATLFIEQSTDDTLTEELLFAFACLDWSEFKGINSDERAEVMPIFALLKHMFLPREVDVPGGEKKPIPTDLRLIPMLRNGRIEDAAALAQQRLRVVGLRPVEGSYMGGMDAERLAAAMLIPVRRSRQLIDCILHENQDSRSTRYAKSK